VEVIFLGGEHDGAQLLQPLRALGPEIDTVAMIPATRLGQLHMDPTHPVPAIGNGMLLHTFGAETAQALDGVAGAGSRSPLLSIEVRHLQGALGVPSPEACAFTLADAGFALYAVGMVMSPEMGAAVVQHIEVMRSALSAWDTGRGTPNFAEAPTGSSSTLYPTEVFERLQDVRSRYDPSGLFRSNHPIPVGA
jgi:hypothetical protein